MSLRLLVPLFVLLALAAGTPALADPGRVVVRVSERTPERSVDAPVATSAAALPDGGVVMAGLGEPRGKVRPLVLVRLDAAGRPDPAFGIAGVARLSLGRVFSPAQLLVRPDGRLLVVGTIGDGLLGGAGLAVVGLTPAGRLDVGYGQNGVAGGSVRAGCGNCAPATLGPDGSLFLAGSGTIAGDVDGEGAVVAHLTPEGSPDPSFGGRDGLAKPAVSSGRAISASAVALTAGGRLRVLTRSSDGLQLSGLSSDGADDPGYGEDGVARISPALASALTMRADPSGRVDVIGRDRIGRFTPAGRLDVGFGNGGEVSFPEVAGGYSPQVLGQADGGLLVFSATSYDPRPGGQPAFLVRGFGSTGASVGAGAPVARQTVPIEPLLGGGYASFGASSRTGAGVDQGSFTPQAVVQRPDGSIVLAGGVKVIRYTGEGEGFSTALFAAVALTAELGQDRSFGGEPSRARFHFRVARQHARSSARLRRILVRVSASGPGLALLRVRDGRHRILAQQVVPIYSSGSTTVRLPLMKTGRRVLRSGGRRVVVGYRFADVVRARTTGVGRARLR